MKNHAKKVTGAGLAPPVGIESLPMARYAFIVHGYLANCAGVSIRGVVYAKRGMYYQARARVLDSILKEIPTLELDDEDPVGLRMFEGKCDSPADFGILGRVRRRNDAATTQKSTDDLASGRGRDNG
ncbi:MAG: hypothetical protein LBM92_01435 [Opitutaceae bacterium]|jgi:hypothetical protein|nr:hypothetical protein [Opitutaceae bacterium]